MRSNLIFKVFSLIFYINISNSYSEELKLRLHQLSEDKDKIVIANEGKNFIRRWNSYWCRSDEIWERGEISRSYRKHYNKSVENIEILSDKITYDLKKRKNYFFRKCWNKIWKKLYAKTKEIVYLKNSKEILINNIPNKRWFGKWLNLSN